MPHPMLDNPLIKKPHQNEQMTSEQMEELRKCMHDVKYFIREYCYIRHPKRGKIQFELFDFQERLIDLYHSNRKSINLLSRQMGKTTCAAAYLLWYAMFHSDMTVLIAAHKQKGADEIMRRIRYIYESCPDFIRAGATTYNKLTIEFDNGSSIESHTTTESTGRGTSPSIVYLDEFAFVRPDVAKEFWTAIRPTLAEGGKCIITSTPNQDDDQFAHIWKQASNTILEDGTVNPEGIGRNGFASMKVTWSEHPNRDEKWAAEERADTSEAEFRREHECEFVTRDETLINPMFLANMGMGVDPKRTSNGDVRWYAPIEDDVTYLAGLDPSMGVEKDSAAILVYSFPDGRQVAEWKDNTTNVEGQIRKLAAILEEIDDAGPEFRHLLLG